MVEEMILLSPRPTVEHTIPLNYFVSLDLIPTFTSLEQFKRTDAEATRRGVMYKCLFVHKDVIHPTGADKTWLSDYCIQSIPFKLMNRLLTARHEWSKQ